MLCCAPPSHTSDPTCRTACWYVAEPLVLKVGLHAGETSRAAEVVTATALRTVAPALRVM